jgi:kynureninase
MVTLAQRGSAAVMPVEDDGWLIFHSVGKFPGQREAMDAALQRFSSDWCAFDDGRWDALEKGRGEAIELWRRLIGAEPGTVMTCENVTACFFNFVEALPQSTLKGQQVLIAEDCFPSLHFLFSELARRLGFELVTVRIRPGADSVEDDDFEAAWTERVALSVVTWVTSTASKKADLGRLVGHGRKMGSLVAVDVTQALGCLPLDVHEPAVDFASSTSLKWMCGVPGAGFGYVAPRLLATLNPRLRGWFSQPDPFNWNLNRFALAEDARRFDNGTPCYLPFIASVPGLRWLHQTGPERILAHNRRLSVLLLEIADGHRLKVVCPRNESERGGTVVVEIPHPTAEKDLTGMLLKRGIFCDMRGNRMRWSPGYVTTENALQRLDEALSDAGL